MISLHQDKKVLALILMIFLVAPLAMGFEFDNRKTYDPDTRTATITNAFGLGDTIATVKLETPLQTWVAPGRDVLVAVMTVDNVDSVYNNFLSKMTFYDIHNFNKQDLIYRTPPSGLNYKQLVITGSNTVQDYEWQCDKADEFKRGKNKIPSCNYVNVGSHSEDQTEWQSFNKENPLQKGVVTIGIFTNVGKGDYVEWVPTLFGKEISEWATFGAAITDGHGQTLIADGTYNEETGVSIVPNANVSLTNVGFATTGSDFCYIYDTSNGRSLVDQQTVVSGLCSWADGEVNLTKDITYSIAIGDSYIGYRKTTGVSYPYVGTNIDITQGVTGCQTDPCINISTQIYSIINVTTKVIGGTEILPGSILVTLTLPSNGTSEASSIADFNATIIPTQINLTNATLYVSHTNGTLFVTKNSSVDNSGNFTTEQVDTFVNGTYYWTYRACGINFTSSHVCFYPSVNNFTFSKVDIVAGNISFPEVSYETSKDTFQTNVSFVAGISVVSSNLWYNGTKYPSTTTVVNSTTYTLTRELELPLITNNTATQFHPLLFEFTYLLNGSLTSQNTSVSTQRVDDINASLLGIGTDTVPFINFTIYDQNSLTPLTASLATTFNFGLNNTQKSFSFSHATEDYSNYTFTFNPSNKSYLMTGVFEFGKSNYQLQSFDFPETRLQNISDGFTEQAIYLLESGNATTFTIAVRASNLQELPGALVEVQRFYPSLGAYLTVQSLTTNNEGRAISQLVVEDVTYRFKVFVNGVLELTSTPTQVICESAPCTITLTLPGVGFEEFGQIGNTSDFSSSLSYDRLTEIFTYTYADLGSDPLGGRLHVRRSGNSGDTVVCSNNDTNAASVITCDISSKTNGTYIATAYLERTSESSRVVGLLLIQKARDIVGSIGIDGLIIGVFLFMGIIMLGLTKPIIGVIFAVVAIFALRSLQIMEIPWLSFLALVSIGIILMWEMRK